MRMTQLFVKPPAFGCSDLVTSDVTGWSSLDLRLTKTVAGRDEFESAPIDHIGVHVVLEEEVGREVFAAGRWRQLETHRGKIATTSPGETWRLRYNNRKEVNTNRMIHLQTPLQTFRSVAEQLNRPFNSIYTAVADDEAITHLALSMLRSVKPVPKIITRKRARIGFPRISSWVPKRASIGLLPWIRSQLVTHGLCGSWTISSIICTMILLLRN